MPPGAPDRAYEGFLELPVPVVLAVLWVAGAVLEGLCIAALYAVVFGASAVGGGDPLGVRRVL